MRRTRAGELDLPRLVAAMATRPAEILGIPKGTIEVGRDADLIVVDPREIEAVTALAKIGGAEGALAIRTLLETAPLGQPAVAPVVSTALVEAWRLGARAPIPQLVGFADNADETARGRALYSLGRLRSASAAAQLLRALNDQSGEVRAIAAKSLTATLADSSGLGRAAVAARLRPLVSDENTGVRINALRALGSFRFRLELLALKD